METSPEYKNGEFNILEQPQNSYWADPFIINRDNKNYIFFEDYDFNNGKGHISYCKIDFIDKFVRADYFMGGLMATLMETECKIYKGID